MKTTQYLDLLSRKLALSGKPLSDNQLSKHLKITRAAVSNYRCGRSHFDSAVALRVADLLDIDPEIVLIDSEMERTESPEVRRIWLRLSKKLGRAAAVTMPTILTAYLMIGMLYAPGSSASERQYNVTSNTYYVKSWLTRLRRWLRSARGRDLAMSA
ncbi:MAG: hypothetical protein AB7P16_25450 [Bradyrhizobium sp.]|uniref:hypothetical protein n=1 Tax=Bradyrhizobium sp. TaxID=376 RepID=UPI003D140BD1